MISSIGGSSNAFNAVALSAQRRGADGAMQGRPGGAPSITLHTQEGDTVTITRKQTPNLTYGPSGGSLASTGLQSNDQFDVQVTGNLSDKEKADIQSVLEKMDSARASMESGDFAGGMEMMRSAAAGGGTVSGVEGPEGPPRGMPPGGMGAAGMQAGGKASGGTDLSSLLDPDNDGDSDSTDQTSVLGQLSNASTSSSSASDSISKLIASLGSRDYSNLRSESTRS